MRKFQPRARCRALQTIIALALLLAAGALLYSRRAALPGIRALSLNGSPESLESGEALPLELQSQEQIAIDMMSWRHGERVPGANFLLRGGSKALNPLV